MKLGDVSVMEFIKNEFPWIEERKDVDLAEVVNQIISNSSSKIDSNTTEKSIKTNIKTTVSTLLNDLKQ